MKNYYEILGLGVDCSQDELRKKYRKLAMQYHPDKNPDNPEYQERFKEIAEAYGVLSDPVKRKEYDHCMASGGTYQHGGGFSYSQEEILKDMFNDPKFQQMFQSMLKEFQKAGMRSSPDFVEKSFFNKKGGMFVGGVMFFGSMAGQAAKRKIKEKLPDRNTFMRSFGRKVGTFLGYKEKESGPEKISGSGHISYTLELSQSDLIQGRSVEIEVPRGTEHKRYKIKIPAGSKPGQKLRLKGKGALVGDSYGDLYIELALES